MRARAWIAVAAACAGDGLGLDATGRPLRVRADGGPPASPGPEGDGERGEDRARGRDRDGGPERDRDAGDPDAARALPPDGPPAARLSELQAAIFDRRCTGEECHVTGIAPHGLILSRGWSHALLVGAPADENPEMVRVAPGDPERSYLIVKLVADDPRNRGRRMPRDGPPFLAEEDIERVRSWIRAGARDD